MVSIEYEMKLEKFEKEIQDEKAMDKKLKILFLNEFDEMIGDILNLKEDLFIDQIKEGVSLLLEDYYTDSCLSDDRLSKLVEKNINEIKSKYKHDYALINKAWVAYEKVSKRRTNNEFFLKNFRKHCIYTDEYVTHNCCANEKDGERNSHFIIVNHSDIKNGIKFVICENCKKVYYSSFILARCYKCKVDYYTSLLLHDENPELLLATWENYHCPQLINEKMKCIKCHEYLYLNMKTGLLMCLNKKCEFVSKPTRILWTCMVCKTEFKSGAIPYNPLDGEVTRRLISQTLLLKHKAHPRKMPCCKLNVFFTDFFHKHTCDGILYESELDDNIIIVCEKCKAINYYDRVNWTCPKCGKRFKDKLNENTTEIPDSPKIKDSPRIRSYKKEKDKEKDKENEEKKNKNFTPKSTQYASKRLGAKKEKELNDFRLNDKEKVIEENNEDENKNNEKGKFESPRSRKHRRFHFNSIHLDEDDKNKIEDKNKNEENNNNNEEDNNEENEDNSYRKNRSRTTYYKSAQKPEENKRLFRRYKFDKNNDDKDKVIIEEKEKENEKGKEKEKEEAENISPRMAWRKRYKRDNASKKDFSLNDEIDKQKEKEEKERKEREEKERKEKEEKERKEKEEKERKEREEKERKEREEKDNKNKEENFGGRAWFRRLAGNRQEKEKESTTKSSKKEKESNENEEESDEDEDNNSIDNNDDEFKEIIKFGKKDSDDEENSKEEIENPMEPDPLYMNININRNKNRRKTRGMIIVGDLEDNKEEEENKNMKKKNAPQIKIAMSKIPGISEHLFNHIKKRMVKILNRCKIPVFDVEDYTFNKKLGEGSYAVIFSVYKNSDKEKKPLALKKIIAKTLTEIDKLTKEFELVHCCLHPNIMEIYGICIRMLDQTTYALYVLMELSHGDWDKEIKMHIMKKKYYFESELINILRQLTGALLFMQQNLKISHRDIKPQNVLLFGNGLYKIADFGEAKEAKLSKQVNTLRGTELYMSPALYSGLKNDKNDVNHDPYKSDVFSLGFCFFYASTLNFNVLYQVRDIYNSNRMNDIIQQHLNKKYSPTFISILSHMMEVDESERFDFPTLVKFIDENYDENGNLKNEEKIEKKSELSQRSNRKKK